jgi:DNA-directed RNA polymerase subunit RPC12/RpoP
MTEFEDVPHTGGVVTIRKDRGTYQLTYTHMRPVRAVFAELFVTREGVPVGFAPFSGMSTREDPPPPEDPILMVMLASDEEGLFGRQCPACNAYFRSDSPVADTHCPYCRASGKGLAFITPTQRAFMRTFYAAIDTAPDGETTVDLDKLLDDVPENRESPWRYTEERQQTRYTCDNCNRVFDVLGEYVRCPRCRKRTNDAVIRKKLAARTSEFEEAERTLTERHDREARWRDLLVGCVSDFDSFANDLRDQLVFLPATPRRRNALRQLSFQNIRNAAARLQEWFDLDILNGVSEEDREFLNVSFNRRHLFVHRAGRVDEEYISNTEDGSVRLHQLVRVRSVHIRRLIPLISTLSKNFVSGVETIS